MPHQAAQIGATAGSDMYHLEDISPREKVSTAADGTPRPWDPEQRRVTKITGVGAIVHPDSHTRPITLCIQFYSTAAAGPPRRIKSFLVYGVDPYDPRKFGKLSVFASCALVVESTK
ncbi:hypothetical protein FRAAL4665 [Frankia alni ACN14a]|uniref:Uncharacterized protein n=1 Tax=Frankia alni (strain DSM 45986 / CECT 9034 / ACN14a) TaxID=326424 RepID=Q0RGS9_FRAAA|nr:hypothetical protein FRAAL4665 [Frankia alni ACN14a]